MSRIYDTRRWKWIRKLQLQEHPLCFTCLSIGRYVAASNVDHVIAIKNGGAPFDAANLRSLCQSCHSSKTASMDSGYGNKRKTSAPIKGCDVSGIPLDPAHPWRDTWKRR